MAEKHEKESRGVTAWDPFADWPFRERGSLLRELGLPSRLARLFEEVGGERGASTLPVAPAVDIAESDAGYTVTAELPGVKREDVTVELHDGVLTIRGEKRSEREEKKERSRWIERTFGEFRRSFTLPKDASQDKIEAAFKDGVLTLKIAKSEASKPKAITIQG
jgi:HSP20 family protein